MVLVTGYLLTPCTSDPVRQRRSIAAYEKGPVPQRITPNTPKRKYFAQRVPSLLTVKGL